MKKQYFLITIICLANIPFCQAQVMIGLLKTQTKYRAINSFLGRNIKNDKDVTIGKGEKLHLLSNDVFMNTFIRADGSQITLQQTDVSNNTKQPFLSALGGAVTFPFKIRMQRNSAIEPSLSLSGVAGVTHPFDTEGKNSASFLLGFGPSSINIDNSNSSDTGTVASTRSAATISATLLFQWIRYN